MTTRRSCEVDGFTEDDDLTQPDLLRTDPADQRLPVFPTESTWAETVAVRTEPQAQRESAARPASSAWVIQLGAMDDEDKAKSMLDEAKSRSGRALAGSVRRPARRARTRRCPG